MIARIRAGANGILLLVLAGVLLLPYRAVVADDPAQKAAPNKKRDEAAQLLRRFDRLHEQYQEQHQRTWAASYAAGFVGSAALHESFPGAAVQLGLRLRLAGFQEAAFFAQQDEGPPELLFAAVGAARAALRADRKDAQAYLLLGEAYYRLAYRTRERAVRPRFVLLDRMRRMQMAAAWNRAVQLQPDNVQAHAQLARLYQDMGYLDLLRKHLRRALECTQAAGPGKDDRERFDQRVKGMKANLDRLDKEVENRLDRFAVGSAGRPVLDQATLALRLGLPDKALEILLASNASVFGVEGAKLELELLLVTGRGKEVGEWLTPKVGEAIGPAAHYVTALHWANSVGDYDEADKYLKKLMALFNPPDARDGKSPSPRSRLGLLLGHMLLDGPHQHETPAQLLLVQLQRLQYWNHVLAILNALREQSDILVLRGLLALERGRGREAADRFREALELWQNDAAASGRGLDFSGRILAQRGLRLAAKSEPPP